MNLIYVQTCIAKKGGAHAPPYGYGPENLGNQWGHALFVV